ncbi:MAG: hypothetical protein Q9205_007573 [Flavoplaca limonia]
MKQETFYPSPNGDEDNGKKYLGAAWALVTCATLSTIVRVWVRSRLTRNMGTHVLPPTRPAATLSSSRLA